MGLEQKINYYLNKYPNQKKMIKRIYQRIMCLFLPKISSVGDITKLSPDDDYEYFFGYYDKTPWDATDRYVLCLKAEDTWSDVSPRKKAEILLIDTLKSKDDANRVKKIAETRAWNVQQSCMLQWLGSDFKEKIIFNDFRSGRLVSVILNLNNMEEKVLPMPIYAVSSDSKFALTLDFSRLYNLRPGYGYYNVIEKTKGIPLPDTTAIWRISLETGEVSEVLKYTDFVKFKTREDMLGKNVIHKVNHIMISPDNKRFMVLHRWFNSNRKYSRLITCNIDGGDMYLLSDDDMVSHCFWKNNEEIIAYENKKNLGTGYFLMNDKTNQYYHCWKSLTEDGHPSCSKDGAFFVTDTYPDRRRVQCIKVMNGDVKINDVKIIAKVFSPFKYDNDTRCDLHPRWNNSGDKICFDSVYEGRRGLYSVDFNREGDKKIKVLYILDSLKQRFGVTSVAMNYFRNIDRNNISIDFLVLEDSEREIINEICDAGSRVFFMPRLSLKNIVKTLEFFNIFFKEHNEYKIIHSHFNQMDSIIFPIAKKNGIKHCISHSHNTKYSDYKLRAVRNYLMCISLKNVADTWASCGIRAGEFLYGKKFLKSKKHLILNNAIDVEKFKYDKVVRDKKRKELDIDRYFVVGTVGSLKLQKNQQFLLKIFKKLLLTVNNPDEYKLIIVGDGNLKNELINLAEELRISKQVVFLGTRNDVNELLQAMDIFILPSLYEGLPVIGIEAQASGIPCILSNNITKEVNICNTEFLTLDSDDDWVRTIIKYRNFNRVDCTNKIVERGFDIKHEAIKLSEYYMNI